MKQGWTTDAVCTLDSVNRLLALHPTKSTTMLLRTAYYFHSPLGKVTTNDFQIYGYNNAGTQIVWQELALGTFTMQNGAITIDAQTRTNTQVGVTTNYTLTFKADSRIPAS